MTAGGRSALSIQASMASQSSWWIAASVRAGSGGAIGGVGNRDGDQASGDVARDRIRSSSASDSACGDQRRERGLPVISASDYRTNSRTAAAAAAAAVAASPVSAASVWLPVAASTSVTTPATHRRRARSLADRGAEGPVHQGASERGETHGLGHVDGGGGLGGGLA